MSSTRTFPIYQITDNIATNDNITTNRDELSIIAPTRTHDTDNYFNTDIQTRYTATYLVICTIVSFLLGCVLMWSYIINNQQISASTDGYYTAVIFGEEYSYR